MFDDVKFFLLGISHIIVGASSCDDGPCGCEIDVAVFELPDVL